MVWSRPRSPKPALAGILSRPAASFLVSKRTRSGQRTTKLVGYRWPRVAPTLVKSKRSRSSPLQKLIILHLNTRGLGLAVDTTISEVFKMFTLLIHRSYQPSQGSSSTKPSLKQIDRRIIWQAYLWPKIPWLRTRLTCSTKQLLKTLPSRNSRCLCHGTEREMVLKSKRLTRARRKSSKVIHPATTWIPIRMNPKLSAQQLRSVNQAWIDLIWWAAISSNTRTKSWVQCSRQWTECSTCRFVNQNSLKMLQFK